MLVICSKDELQLTHDYLSKVCRLLPETKDKNLLIVPVTQSANLNVTL